MNRREWVKMNRREWVKASFVIGIVGIIVWAGFDYEYKKLDSCVAESKKWWIAEFSENNIFIDDDGMLSTNTTYWDEIASDIWSIKTINGVINNSNGLNYKISNDLAVLSHYPPKWEEMKMDLDFDNFSKKSENIYYFILSDGSYTKENFNSHKRCMKYLNKKIMIKTWYGISISATN